MNTYTVYFEGNLIVQASDTEHAKKLVDETLVEFSSEHRITEVTE